MITFEVKADLSADVTIAKDGQEALDLVRESMANGERFNLVFMDIQMPNLDGIQSTRRIREMGFSAPIVALTAFAEESNMKECMDSGMNYFLPKPIRRPALKQVLKKYCATIPEEDVDGGATSMPRLNGVKSNPTEATDEDAPSALPKIKNSMRGTSYDSDTVSPLS